MIDPDQKHFLSWRDRITGPFTIGEIQQKLRSRQINSLYKIQVDREWILVRDLLVQYKREEEKMAAEKKVEQEYLSRPVQLDPPTSQPSSTTPLTVPEKVDFSKQPDAYPVYDPHEDLPINLNDSGVFRKQRITYRTVCQVCGSSGRISLTNVHEKVKCSNCGGVTDLRGSIASPDHTEIPSGFFNRITTWKGRIGRMQYFLAQLCLLVFLVVLGVIPMLITAIAPSLMNSDIGAFIFIVFFATIFVVSVVVGWSLSVRRAHDMGWSGWSVLLMAIPYIGFIFNLVWFLNPGSKGANTYGEGPHTILES